MAILRKNNREKYTVVDNDIIRDERLTLKSFGLLVKLLSLPDNWEFSEKGLEAIFVDGIASIRSGLKDLEKFGYLKRNRVRDDKGRISNVEWIIFEKPTFQPQLDFLNVDNPNLDNRIQSNTNISNTNNNIYTIGDSECVDSFITLYEDIIGKPYREIKNLYNIENLYKIEDYDINDLKDIIQEHLFKYRGFKNKCTLEYFCKVIDRYR